MNPVDRQLDRLLKAASQAPRTDSNGPVFGLETRVLAHWRTASRQVGGEFYVAWFRRAAIFAGLLAMAGLAWNHHNSDPRSSAEVVADSAMGIGIEP